MIEQLIDFDKWCDWIFAKKIGKPIWFFEQGVNYNVSYEITLKHLISLFKNPELLLDKYSLEQIEQGFWIIAGAGGIMTPVLISGECLLKDRMRCIESMENIFITIFSKYPLDVICHMWWDELVSITSDYRDENSNIPTDVENAGLLRKSIFDTVAKILFMSSERCQKSALHALGHLQYSGKKKLIFEYLNSELEISDEIKAYSKRCITGNVL